MRKVFWDDPYQTTLTTQASKKLAPISQNTKPVLTLYSIEISHSFLRNCCATITQSFALKRKNIGAGKERIDIYSET